MSDEIVSNEPTSLDDVRRRGGVVKEYGTEKREAKKPFAFRVGESPVVTVYEPDAGIIMDIEEAQSTRKVLRLFLGDDYASVEEYLEGLHGDELVEMARDLSRHFGLFDTQSAVNRAQRRRSGRK